MGCDKHYSDPSTLNRHMANHRRLLKPETAAEDTSPSFLLLPAPLPQAIDTSYEHPTLSDVLSPSWSTDHELQSTHLEYRPLAPGHGDQASTMSPSLSWGDLYVEPNWWAGGFRDPWIDFK